mgnify:CR=1 FL=1
MWTRIALLIGAFYGMTGVALGAMGAHALKSKLSERFMNAYLTGTKYQLMHALLLIMLGILVAQYPSKWMTSAIICTALGVLLFSGSLYALTLLEWKVGIITPIGGVFLIVGWFSLLVAAFQIGQGS